MSDSTRSAGALALAAVFSVVSALVPLPAGAAPATKQATTLRVMLNPSAAPRGQLPAALREHLQRLAGTPLAHVGTTRTGALEVAVAGPRDAASLDAVAKRLRTDRAVLWAEASTLTVAAKAKLDAKAAATSGRKLMVRFHDGVDASAMLPRLASIAGVPVAIERTIGDVQVVGLATTTTLRDLDALAKSFESLAEVRYADAVRTVQAHAAPPNDPRYGDQWSLVNIRAGEAWQLGTGSASVTVAVVDTGILPHPDLDGRLLPGYDMISDADRARDGNGRDADPRDEGDWHGDGDCDGSYAQASFFHGLFVAGQIAANSNNGVGISGLDWAAKVLPVRVLGKCGGTFDDVVAGIMWASGQVVSGAPLNTHPAKVVNLSLGGYGVCSAAAQEAIDAALAMGSVVVASAGNESDDASLYAPANCSGVITVGALSRVGDRSGYSNFGTRVDLSAPGGDVGEDGLILSTVALGSTTPGAFDYGYGAGTSFAAPLVSGTVSLMLARNPNLTVGQVLAKLQGTTAEFKAGSTCASGFCGTGALDSGTALTATIPAATDLPPGATAVVEFYDRALDHYLVTSNPDEIANLDAFGAPRWERTGHVFYAWADPAFAPPGAFPRGVCRFYAGPQSLIDSHYFTADPIECSTVASTPGSAWTLQTNAAFWVEVPNAEGVCRAGLLPVFRFFNNRRDANYRYTIDLSVRRAMLNRVWVPHGAGANGVAFCSLI